MATIDGTKKKLTVSGEAIESAVNSKHEHVNSAVLNKLTDKNGTLQYNGSDITGGTITNIDGGVFAEVASLTSISAVYTQGGTVVYPSTSLNDLKSNLVVTANYSDSTTATVTDYTLSGTLLVGTSTITVSYEGKNTIFEVTVSNETTTISYSTGYYNDEGVLTPLERNYVDNNYLPANASTSYQVLTPFGVENIRLNEYDADKNFIQRNYEVDGTGSETWALFNTTSTTAFVKIGFAVTSDKDNKESLDSLFSTYIFKTKS